MKLHFIELLPGKKNTNKGANKPPKSRKCEMRDVGAFKSGKYHGISATVRNPIL